MLIWIFRIIVIIAGPVISYFQIARTTQGILVGVAGALIVIAAEIVIQKVPLDTLIVAIIGTILGLVGAKLLDYTVYLMDNASFYEFMKSYSLLIKVILGYLGLVIAVRKKSELDLLDKDILKRGANRKQADSVVLLDTSAIIDGRVSDIATTRFLSGTLVVPRFVLDELQALADSSDTHKRNRARRGLDIVAQLQKDEGLSVKIFDKDYPELRGVDAKLLQLGKDLAAKILTTDFNLNKVASLHGVIVLNINDLSNALKPVYLPGEAMPIFVVKEGKEGNQGIGYLDDGTMVVVEEGRRFIGKRAEVIVTSILQTSSGRMIFTRPADGNGHEHRGDSRAQEFRSPERYQQENRQQHENRGSHGGHENRNRDNRGRDNRPRGDRDNRRQQQGQQQQQQQQNQQGGGQQDTPQGGQQEQQG